MQQLKPAAKALVIFEGRFVLVQRDNRPDILNPNKWNLPGGQIEEGESPEQAIARELHEEIALSPSQISSMGTTLYTQANIRYTASPL